MKSRPALVIGVLVALIVAGATLVYAQSGPPGAGRDPHTLTGSWIVSSTPDEGSPVGPFRCYTAYLKDDVAISIASAGTQLIGTWTRTGGNRFATMYMGTEPWGGEILQLKAWETIELSSSGQAFTGRFVTEVSPPDGSWHATVSGDMAGTRMQVEPLD